MPSTVGIVAGSRDDFSVLDYQPHRWYDASDYSTIQLAPSTGAYVGPDGLYTQSPNFNADNLVSYSSGPLIGNVDVIVQLSCANWSTAYVDAAEAGSGAYMQANWRLSVSSGSLVFAGASFGVSRTLPTWQNNSTHWIRAQRNESTGVIKLFSSDDGLTFTQLGADHSGTSGSLNPLYYGHLYIGKAFGYIGATTAGFIKTVQVWNGAFDSGGVKVFDLNLLDPRFTFATTFYETVRGGTVTLTSASGGARVIRMSDKSGNNRHATVASAASAYQPSMAGDEANLRYSVFFDSLDYLTEPTTINAPIHTFIVVRRIGNTGFLYDKGQVGGNSARWYLYRPASNDGWYSPVGNSEYQDLNQRILVESVDGSSSVTKFGTNTVISGETSIAQIQGLTLMARYSESEHLRGYLCEVIQFPLLTPFQARRVREYLGKKWNVPY